MFCAFVSTLGLTHCVYAIVSLCVVLSGGYCSEATTYIEGLAAANISRLQIVQQGDNVQDSYVESIDPNTMRLLRRLENNVQSTASSVCICHAAPVTWHHAQYDGPCPPDDAMFRVGRTMFETDSVPAFWVPHIQSMDRVWVPTQFHVEVFAKAGIDRSKIIALPEPVDTDFFDPVRTAPLVLPDRAPDQFVFVSVFKWEQRKGWEFLVESFVKAFNASDNVALYILTHIGTSETSIDGLNSAVRRVVASVRPDSVPSAPPIRIRGHISDDRLPHFYKAADAFVIASRGEGWGRPHVEAMSMQLPVIATNWSGPTEFLNERNGYPIPIERLERVEEHGPLSDHLWARPNVTALSEIMQRVYHNRTEALTRAKQARKDMVNKYCISCVNKYLMQEFRTIQRRLLPRKLLSHAT
jgi:glycosyltransferase involved in cell wall biosynthesis